MIRVLHTGGPEEASRRLAFLGIPPAERESLLRDLRPFLLWVPSGEFPPPLPERLTGLGIPSARAGGDLVFSVSSAAQLDSWRNGGGEVDGFLSRVGLAIRRYLSREFDVPCGGRVLEIRGTPRIMGILNVTPDSFSDGGKYLSFEAAVRRGLELVEEGAEIVDIGGESTRPGSLPVAADEESLRVVPVIRELAGRTKAILSIDTTKAAVARESIEAGAVMINDTSALSDDPEMAAVARESGCAVVLMHRRGKPATMQRSPGYGSLFGELLAELSGRIDAAVAAGIPPERIIVDPGVGFGKRLEDNLALHRHLQDLRNLGRPILFGPSRKSFLGRITGKEPADRLFGTAGAVAAAVSGGADILRVHDVREMRDVIGVVSAIRQGAEC